MEIPFFDQVPLNVYLDGKQIVGDSTPLRTIDSITTVLYIEHTP